MNERTDFDNKQINGWWVDELRGLQDGRMDRLQDGRMNERTDFDTM